MREGSRFGDLVRERIANFMLDHDAEPTEETLESILDDLLEGSEDPALPVTVEIIETARKNSSFNRGRRLNATELSRAAVRALEEFELYLDLTNELYRRMASTFVGWTPDSELSDDEGSSVIDGEITKPLMLLSLHSRICTIGAEIALLFRERYVDACLSRLRTLYELSVVGCALATAAPEVSARFFAAGMLERLADLKARTTAHDQLGWPPPDVDELAEVEAQCDVYLQEYGPAIKHSSGWAKPLFPDKAEKWRPNFADIEAHVGDTYRTVYKILNHSVHSGPAVTARRLYYDPAPQPPTRSHQVSELNLIIGGATAFTLHLSYAIGRHLASSMVELDDLFVLRALISQKRKVDKVLEG